MVAYLVVVGVVAVAAHVAVIVIVVCCVLFVCCCPYLCCLHALLAAVVSTGSRGLVFSAILMINNTLTPHLETPHGHPDLQDFRVQSKFKCCVP